MITKIAKPIGIVLLTLSALWALTGTGCKTPSASPAKRYVITDFGAVGDGQTVNTKAIQSAIDRCARAAAAECSSCPKARL